MDAATALLHLPTSAEAVAVLGHLLAIVHAVAREEVRTVRDPRLRQPFLLHACPLGGAVVHGGPEARRSHIPSLDRLQMLEEVAAATSGWSASGRIAIFHVVADATRPMLEDIPGPGALEARSWGEIHKMRTVLEETGRRKEVGVTLIGAATLATVETVIMQVC